MPVSPEVTQVVRLLRERIRDAGWTLRAVARELGWHEDYLSQLFRGSPQLKLEQLFAVLRVIDLSPADFFAGLASSFADPWPARAGRPAAAPAPAGGGLDLEDLEGLIDSRIRRVLGTLGGAEEPARAVRRPRARGER